MKSKDNLQKVSTNKVFAIMSLFILSIGIMLSGTVFTVFSVINNVTVPVLKANIHGSVFGVVIVYLGLRYFLSVKKLKNEVYKNTSNFSWNNFKKQNKALSKSR